MVAAFLAHRVTQRAPLQAHRLGDVPQRLLDALLHATKPADIDVGVGIGQDIADGVLLLAQLVLDIALGLTGNAAERAYLATRLADQRTS